MFNVQHSTQHPPADSLEADGAGDHEQPYRFGFRPRASHPYPFSTRQYARLLILRSRVPDSRDFEEDRARLMTQHPMFAVDDECPGHADRCRRTVTRVWKWASAPVVRAWTGWRCR